MAAEQGGPFRAVQHLLGGVNLDLTDGNIEIGARLVLEGRAHRQRPIPERAAVALLALCQIEIATLERRFRLLDTRQHGDVASEFVKRGQ